MRFATYLLLPVAASACAAEQEPLRPGPRRDGGSIVDATVRHDAGQADAGHRDGGAPPDSGARDGGVTPRDAGPPDAGVPLDAGILPVEIAVGYAHACARTNRDTVRCWGSSYGGALGRPSVEVIQDPVAPVVDAQGQPFTGVVEIAVGSSHSLARTSDGRAHWWGFIPIEGAMRQNAPTSFTTSGTANVVDAHHHHMCVADASGVYCAGSNDCGELGDGTFESRFDARPVQGVGPVDDLDVGPHRSCVVTNGEVWCWGWQLFQLPAFPCPADLSPQRVLTISDAVEVETTQYFVCARTAGGAVVCRGMNQQGQLGATPSPSEAEVVTIASGVVQLAVGTQRAFALLDDGRVLAWGSNTSGALGVGDTQTRSRPTPVMGLTDVVQISAGYARACALTSDGEIWCWGRNNDPTAPDDLVPRRVPWSD